MYYKLQAKHTEIEQLAKDCLDENAMVTITQDAYDTTLPCEVTIHLGNKGKTTKGKGLKIDCQSISNDCKVIFKFYALENEYTLDSLSTFGNRLDKIIME